MGIRDELIKILKPNIDRHKSLTVKCLDCGGGVCRSGICHTCSVADEILVLIESGCPKCGQFGCLQHGYLDNEPCNCIVQRHISGICQNCGKDNTPVGEIEE